MRRILASLVLLCTVGPLMAQVPAPQLPPPTSTVEQQLENITENSEDMATEDDSYLQQLNQLQRNPLNINAADESVLRELRILSPMQIENFLSYRSMMGSFISIYELQAVPGWDLLSIQKIRPYLSLNGVASFADIRTRLRNGDRTLLIRTAQTLERSRGYRQDASSARSFYPGSPQRLFVRYKYTYKNLLQYGVVGEKDPGEQFFKGSQKQGFDFYSAHFFLRNAGIVKSLAVGDFTVNMGQGLTQWMSLAFKKGPDIMSVKRQSPVLRPYNSAGEIFFHRGAGVTVGKKNWQGTVFGSLRRVDANFNAMDSSNGQDDFISSLQLSGLHRTSSEVTDKGAQRQMAFGGNFSFRLNRLRLAINAVQFKMKYPLIKSDDPYNLFAINGKQFGNYSADFSYTLRNMHFFGEVAVTDKNYPAVINGLLLSVANNVDMSFFYRNISRGYQSLYTNAFTESTYPTNENGFFSGISVKPNASWKIDSYADIYRFPWLRARVNAPTEGKDYMLQVTYKPNKIFEIYTRYKAEAKLINYNPGQLTISPVVAQPRKNWRTHLVYQLNPKFTVRSRAEIVWFDKKGAAREQGFLLFGDLLYKPMMAKLSANMRLQYFETEGYNSRLYAFENDVLYSYSIPVFYDKGYRAYCNVNFDLTKKVSVWGRWARFIYLDKSVIGSGLDEIQGNHKTEVKFQVMYKF